MSVPVSRILLTTLSSDTMCEPSPRRDALRCCVDGDEAASGRSEVGPRADDLVALPTHPEDEVGLGDHSPAGGLSDHVEAALVPEVRPDRPEDPWHGLDVVGEDLRCGVEHLVDEVEAATGVGHEDLDADADADAGRWIWRTVSAQSQAPSAPRSSRVTPVTVA